MRKEYNCKLDGFCSGSLQDETVATRKPFETMIEAHLFDSFLGREATPKEMERIIKTALGLMESLDEQRKKGYDSMLLFKQSQENLPSDQQECQELIVNWEFS